MQTIDINVLEWFDKVNGNSYFAGNIVIDFALPTEKTVPLPFQYGYGDHYKDMAGKELESRGLISLEHYDNGGSEAIWRYCERNGIILRTAKHENRRKRDLTNLHK